MLQRMTQPHSDEAPALGDMMKSVEGISDYEAIDQVGAWCMNNLPYYHVGFHHSFGHLF